MQYLLHNSIIVAENYSKFSIMDSLHFIFVTKRELYFCAKIIVELLKISTAFVHEPLKNYHQIQIAEYLRGLKLCYVKY